jgi:hypothetical protein
MEKILYARFCCTTCNIAEYYLILDVKSEVSNRRVCCILFHCVRPSHLRHSLVFCEGRVNESQWIEASSSSPKSQLINLTRPTFLHYSHRDTKRPASNTNACIRVRVDPHAPPLPLPSALRSPPSAHTPVPPGAQRQTTRTTVGTTAPNASVAVLDAPRLTTHPLGCAAPKREAKKHNHLERLSVCLSVSPVHSFPAPFQYVTGWHDMRIVCVYGGVYGCVHVWVGGWMDALRCLVFRLQGRTERQKGRTEGEGEKDGV